MPESLTGLIKDISILIAFFAVFCTAFSAIIVAKIQSTTQLKAKSMDLYFDSKFSAYLKFISACMELQAMCKFAIPVDNENFKVESLFVKHEEYMSKFYEAGMKVDCAAAAASLLANPAIIFLIDSCSRDALSLSQEIVILDDEHEVVNIGYYLERFEGSNKLLNHLIEQMQEDLYEFDHRRTRKRFKKCSTR